MASVNFSVPEELKQAFNATVEGQNKSAVIAALLREAVDRAQRRQRHREAVARIVANQASAPAVSEADFIAARQDGRP